METKIDHIIARVLSGESSCEDLLSLSEWLHAEGKNREEFSQLKNYWDAEVSFNEMLLPAVSMEKVQQQIRTAEKKRRQSLRWRIWTPVAATIALFVLIAAGYLSRGEHVPREYYTYLTQDNRTHFTLDDGTRIALNMNSRLTYTNTYHTDDRHVRLEGEAYFEVTSDPAHPFRITIAGDEEKEASITVLGTEFGVKIDADEKQVIATLVSGSIVFEAKDQVIRMQPDQQLVYTFDSRNINISEVNAADEVLWKDGLIKYKMMTLVDLMKELEKRYRTRIMIRNKRLLHSSVTVSGTFTEAQSLDQVLEVISRSVPIRWTKDADGYYIR